MNHFRTQKPFTETVLLICITRDVGPRCRIDPISSVPVRRSAPEDSTLCSSALGTYHFFIPSEYQDGLPDNVSVIP
jgi:hypothetical protein